MEKKEANREPFQEHLKNGQTDFKWAQQIFKKKQWATTSAIFLFSARQFHCGLCQKYLHQTPLKKNTVNPTGIDKLKPFLKKDATAYSGLHP